MIQRIENIAVLILAIILVGIVILFMWPVSVPPGGAIGTAGPLR